MKNILYLTIFFTSTKLLAQTHVVSMIDTTAVKKIICETYQLKENLADGEWKVIHPGLTGGRTIIDATIKNGKREGEYSEFLNYNFCEMKSLKCNYKNGKIDGLYQIWYAMPYESQLSDSGYYKDGKIEGIYTTWGKFDKSKKQVPYINGRKQGIGTEWDKNGNKTKEWNYKNDEGKYTAWDKDGKMIESGIYKNDLKEGVFYTYFPSGQKKNLNTYKDGKLEGLSFSWYETGEKWDSAWFKNDKPDGTHVLYYKNGQMKRRTFESQRAFGSNSSWYENGQLQSVMIIDFKKLTTDIYLWSDKGVLTKEEHHKVIIRVPGSIPVTKYDPMYVFTYNVILEEQGEFKSPKTTVTEKYEKQLIPRPEGEYEIHCQQHLIGVQRIWSDKGVLLSYATFEDRYQIGKETKWYDTGIKQSEGVWLIVDDGNYKHSVKDGKWSTWNFQGNLQKEQTYDKGKLIEEKNY